MKKIMLYLCIQLFLSIHISTLCFQENNFIQKQGGICFRIDDNQPMSWFEEYAAIFNQNNYNFSFALNLGKQIDQAYINGVSQLQDAGHEMLDHSPDHRTNYFNTIFNPSDYNNLPGVDHIVADNKICLEHAAVDITNSTISGIGDIINSRLISNSNGAFKFLRPEDRYIYFDNLNELVWIIEFKNLDSSNPDTLRFKDVWYDHISLGYRVNEAFHIFDFENVSLTKDGYNILAKETMKLADHYGFERPKSWIQPGGYHPRAHREDLCESIGAWQPREYITGAVYPNSSLKVFNESDPNNDKCYGMQWGDFFEDSESLQQIKSIIADRIAKHHVLIGHSHFNNLLGGWTGYLTRMNLLLEWCREKNIPVRTYSEWANILYYQTPNPYENVFPSLSVDKDGNNVPDGYEKTGASNIGTWDRSDGVQSSNFHSYSINSVGQLCNIKDLAGIEKGIIEYEIWTKGALGNFIEVIFAIGSNQKIYKFPATTTNWKKYNLNQSINGNTSLSIPENISLVNVSIRCSEYSSGEVKISGMHLAKQKDLTECDLNVKIFLEGAYVNGEKMNSLSLNNIPKSQPFNSTPWHYEGNECVDSFPNNNIVDWILVSLKSEVNDPECLARRAGFLDKDGTIVDIDGASPLKFRVDPGSYYIIVDHRNHLKVMSSNKKLIQ